MVDKMIVGIAIVEIQKVADPSNVFNGREAQPATRREPWTLESASAFMESWHNQFCIAPLSLSLSDRSRI